MTWDRRALRRGITTFVAIAVPSGLLIALLNGSQTPGHESGLWIVAALLIFVVAPFVAGAVAGGAQESPFVHGALVVAAPGGAFLVLRSLVGVARGNLTATEVTSFVLYLAIVTALGMLGGYMGFRRRHRLAE